MKIKQIKSVQVNVAQGEAIQLPKKVDVQLADEDVIISMNAIWEDFDEEQLSNPGTYEVHGHITMKEFPKPLIEQRADPYIYKHTDGYYYFTGSYPLYDRIVLRRAKTISGLKDANEVVIWWKHEEGAMGNHIWAPEIHYIDNKWYIHFAAGRADDPWAIRPYVLECKDENPLTGNWEEKGKVNTNYEGFSLDATTFEHRGKQYLIWAQSNPNSNLYIAEMENPWTIKGEQILITQPEFDWECIGFKVNEGAAVIKRNGRIFVAFSASATDHNYAVGFLTADENSDLLNPKSWGKTNEPVFVTNEQAKEYGPGHNSFTIAEDGETDLIVYHARPYKEIEGDSLFDHNRHARVQEMFWTLDGRPYLGKPGQTLNGNETKVIARIIRE